MKIQRHSDHLADYVRLIGAFLEGRIDTETFERLYLEKFKTDATDWSEDEYEVLNNLFGDIDAFCSEPELCGPEDLNETELRQRSAIAVEKLQRLALA